jgi:hypothetical protein
MNEYYFDFTGTGSIKAKTLEDAIKKLNSYNMIGLKPVVVNSKGKFRAVKTKLHDIEITYENPTTV